ncbi:hypothetical protein DL95DRAFT_467302 [Leptodontidium sp. 2 PMI_412]|nr:hypothetical protein DL95DRAFT_467302 [Leptodontidium sp. 2 PMI_412]
MPHDLFTSPRAVSNLARTKYRQAGCPDDALKYSMAYIRHESSHLSEEGWEGTNPLGDPVPFSAYLIGRIARNPNFVDPKNGKGANFNLDADCGYGYLCWDWTRLAASEPKTHQNGRDHFFPDPVSWPGGPFADKDAKKWVEDTASGVGAKLHSQKLNGDGPVVQYDMTVNYFGRDGCKETDEGSGEEEPPSIIKYLPETIPQTTSIYPYCKPPLGESGAKSWKSGVVSEG